MSDAQDASGVSGSEVLFQSGLVRLCRSRRLDGADPVLLKEYLGRDAPQRMQHELRILERLRDVPGVPQVVSGDFLPGVIALADPVAVPLATMLRERRWDTRQLLEFALQLARVVAGIHRAGVAHKNLSVDSILWCLAKDSVAICDFSLATTFAEERPGFVHHRDIAGSLPYLAPEQTGRTGRPVDYRADLYALGAILYRVATGVLPFTERDPLQLIHDILAQTPVPPVELDDSLPRGLSRIIMRLLHKEPDRRYQSAEGVAYDLGLLSEALGAGKHGDLTLGERDFPLKLSAPSRLVGRDAEIAALHDAMEKAFAGEGGALVVSGAPGVGKTAIINELRPMVAARRGWFVSGKFDQYRRDVESDAVRQALRALGRLLLAEPDGQLAPLRERMSLSLGPNCGISTSLIPEFAAILGTPPQPLTGDALQNKERLVQGAADILRTVASPERPLVLVLDDLQWAAPTPLALVDLLMTEPLPGLFLVAAYRDTEVDAVHPLSPMLSRWAAAPNPPPSLQLSNLSPTDLAVLLQHMLRLRIDDARELAAAVAERTNGNPYYTVELVNALRREGILTLEEEGWRWDTAAIRRYVGGSDLLELLVSRIARFPAKTRVLVDSIAYLGGEVPVALLGVAAGLSQPEVEQGLVPALEDGLLVLESEGKGAVTFRHDRVQQAAFGRLEHSARLALHLELARRLAAYPEFAVLAAEQYLPAVGLLDDPAECRQVIALCRDAAARMKCLNFANTERFLAAALQLLQRVATPYDASIFAELETELHAALYSLARLDEADQVYRSIESRCSQHAVHLSAAACLQVCSLTNRGRPGDAVAFGLSVLDALGVAVPPQEELQEEIARGLDLMERWGSEVSVAGDLERPEVSDRRILAIARLINRMIPPAYFSGHPSTYWLVLLCQRLWVEQGPCAALVGPLSHASFMTVAVRGDYRTGYRVVRHALAVSEARGYEPDTSQSRFLFSLSSGIWFEPLEESVALAQRSHEGLLQGGDLQNACFTYYSSIPALFDCAGTLETFGAALDSCLTFAARTGNAHCTAHFRAYEALAHLLVGKRDQWQVSAAALQEMSGTTAAQYHANRALAAAIFGEPAELVHHAAEGMKLYAYFVACYATASLRLLHALSLAQSAADEAAQERGALLAELDAAYEWLEARGADAPENYLHLAHWVKAERAWVLHDLGGALSAFEAAMAEVVVRQRPWQRALITERAALCHLAHGLERSGTHLMGDAVRHYRSWGAHAKVRQLERAYPRLRVPLRKVEPEHRYGVSSDAVDLLAVLRGSQALSSETSLERLRAQVVTLLESMTGATGVSLVMWQEEGGGGWHLLPPVVTEERHTVPLEQAAARRELPVAIFRYVERTRAPLLVDDAKRDDRFAFDPYFFPLECCSVLALPILNHGALRAVLLLENRLSRGAFSDERLDAVKLLAGQLAVSLENVLLYEKLEERVRLRTAELSAAQSQLVATARQAGMAEIATNVLHNVGNVLNSVNISAGVVMHVMDGSKAKDLSKVVQLVKEQGADLPRFMAEDHRGRLLPAYLEKLSAALDEEQRGIVGELSRLIASVDHIKEIVAAQQSYAGGSSMMEPTCISELVEDALRMNAVSLERHQVTVVKDFAEIPAVPLDRARVLQILVNLISNAKHAMAGMLREAAVMTLRTEVVQGRLRLAVADEGEGIAPENLLRIFAHGFTTRKGGHGFGLHSCALAAKEMGGTLTAESAGIGKGAVFTLELPVVA